MWLSIAGAIVVDSIFIAIILTTSTIVAIAIIIATMTVITVGSMIASAIYIWYAASFKWLSLYHRWLGYTYQFFPVALDIVLCVII